jgi:hypothetical protein
MLWHWWDPRAVTSWAEESFLTWSSRCPTSLSTSADVQPWLRWICLVGGICSQKKHKKNTMVWGHISSWHGALTQSPDPCPYRIAQREPSTLAQEWRQHPGKTVLSRISGMPSIHDDWVHIIQNRYGLARYKMHRMVRLWISISPRYKRIATGIGNLPCGNDKAVVGGYRCLVAESDY